MRTSQHKPMLAIYCRWMLRRDMESVLAIDHDNFQYPWIENDFVLSLRARNCIGMAAERAAEKGVVGFFIYELHADRLQLLRIAVHAGYQRQGVGEQIIRKLTTKLSRDKRKRLCTVVPESNLEAQLFFKAMGFKAIGVQHNPDDEDGYEFVYRYREANECNGS